MIKLEQFATISLLTLVRKLPKINNYGVSDIKPELKDECDEAPSWK